MLKRLIACLVAALAAAPLGAQVPQPAAPVTAIRAGRLLDPEAGRILTNQIILVSGTKITDVGPNVAIPSGAQVIDLSRMTVMPGLRLTERLGYFVSGSGFPDCLLLGSEMLSVGVEGVRAAGFFLTAHAGEEGPPEYIREALDVLHARRIDHGVRAIEDPLLVAELAERDIVLNTCPTSNIVLGVYPSFDEHPLPLLRAAGVRVTLGEDESAVSVPVPSSS